MQVGSGAFNVGLDVDNQQTNYKSPRSGRAASQLKGARGLGCVHCVHLLRFGILACHQRLRYVASNQEHETN